MGEIPSRKRDEGLHGSDDGVYFILWRLGSCVSSLTFQLDSSFFAGVRMRQRAFTGEQPACSHFLSSARSFLTEFELYAQVAQLDEATTAAEQNFARFKIDKAEIASRRSWNQATRAQVSALGCSRVPQ